MDQAILVASGQKLLKLLDGTDIKPRAALWVHNTDTNTWRLWVVPAKTFTQKEQLEFYRRLAETISENRAEMLGLDASDVEMVLDDHPAIRGLTPVFHVEGISSVSVSNNLLNGFYLPDGIILRMAV